MLTHDVGIIGLGMVTPVGLSAVETSGSVRSGVMRFNQREWLDARLQPFTVADVPDEALPELPPLSDVDRDLTPREDRLLRLGTRAVKDCIQNLEKPALDAGLLLALPDRHTAIQIDHNRLLQLVWQCTGKAFNLKKSNVAGTGRAAGLSAIGQAAELIRQGKSTLMLAGGIDSFLDLFILEFLSDEGRIKSEVNLDGFIPGEGAAFVLLSAVDWAKQMGLPLKAVISQTFEDTEKGHLYSDDPCRGEGLAAAFKKLFALHQSTKSVKRVYSSMNGESFWGKEWGICFIRNKDRFTSDCELCHPADCLGDAGAASGPILVGLAACRIASHPQNDHILVYCSSDGGDRTALIVNHPTNI
jgi:3-oxoacyl-[acyl-carrier-protein] synthase-1